MKTKYFLKIDKNTQVSVIRKDKKILLVTEIPKGWKKIMLQSPLPSWWEKTDDKLFGMVSIAALGWAIFLMVYFCNLHITPEWLKVILLASPIGWIIMGIITLIPMLLYCFLIKAPISSLLKQKSLGLLPQVSFGEFLNKFSERKKLGSWIVLKETLETGWNFYKHSPNMFQKAIDRAKSIEEFKILYGLRK
jgi:hypothetical protein